LRRWFTESVKGQHSWEHDEPVAEWLKNQFKEESSSQLIKDHLKVMKTESMMSQFRTLIRQMNDEEMLEAGIFLSQNLSPSKREEFVQATRSPSDVENSEVPLEESKKDDSSASENGFF